MDTKNMIVILIILLILMKLLNTNETCKSLVVVNIKSKLMLLILVIVGGAVLYHPEPDWLVYYNTPLASISYLAVLASAIFVGYQAKLFLKDYKNKNERAEFEMSYKLADYYSREIIPYLTPVKIILDDLNRRVDNEYDDKFIYFEKFTTGEAKKIFEKDAAKEFCDLYTEPIPRETLIKFFSLYEGKTQLEIEIEWKKILTGVSAGEENVFYLNKSAELRKAIVIVFNKLEYFSMFFCSGLAIPGNVYMSLHQTFIRFLAVGYLYICKTNCDPGHEFYTHTIELFKEWKKEFINQELVKRKKLDAIDKEMENANKCQTPKKIHQD